MDSKRIENAFIEVVEALGDVEYKEELKDTPKRIADSYKEIFYGIDIDPKEVLTRTFEVNSNELIMEKDIDFYSMCEHHFLPFFGTICIAYIPNKKIFGFGDILKLIEILSRRPQLQERLTEEIAKYIYELLDCQGVYVVVEAKHLCMTMRGQKKENTKILTTSAKGVFETDINKVFGRKKDGYSLLASLKGTSNIGYGVQFSNVLEYEYLNYNQYSNAHKTKWETVLRWTYEINENIAFSPEVTFKVEKYNNFDYTIFYFCVYSYGWIFCEKSVYCNFYIYSTNIVSSYSRKI